MATRGSPKYNYIKRKRSSSLPEVQPPEMDSNGPIPPVDPVVTNDVEPEAPTGQLDIEEKVEDIIILENETALFECKVLQDLKPTCTWHKDGTTLQSDFERISITKHGAWHRLEITHVTFSDQGIYTLECRDEKQYISVKGHLYVAPRKINRGVFYDNRKYVGSGVTQHLRNVHITKGEKIRLDATFSYRSLQFIWFKNNDILLKDRRTTIDTFGYGSTLTIVNARPTDAGVYFLVSKTEQGYLSSFADVIVGHSNEKRLPLPVVEEHLPDEVEVFLGEEARLITRVHADRKTRVEWDRNGLQIIENETKEVDLGYNYFALKLSNPALSSSAPYRLYAKNMKTKRIVSTSTKLKVHDAAPYSPPVTLLRPLETAMACCGVKVSFDCRFNLDDPIYYYVVWYVGHFKVERTNSHFNIISNGAQYLLYIKKFEPGMAGEVICELRRSYPKNRSIMVGRATGRLIMLPVPMIQEARTRTRLNGKLYYEEETNDVNIRVHDIKQETRALTDHKRVHMPWLYKYKLPWLRPPKSPPENRYSEEPRTFSAMKTINDLASQDEKIDYLLKVVYCRLSDNGLYFLQAVRGPMTDASTFVKVQASLFTYKAVVFDWNCPPALLGLWFKIELGQANGSYAVAGISSSPRFTVDNPPIDRMMIFRITAVEPPIGICSAEVNITPPSEMEQHLEKRHEIQNIEVYNSNYIVTNEIIGAGAFGSVHLVKDKASGAFYAAKIVKARTERKRDRILREFNIMQKLHHPKLIELIGFYEAKNTYVFVMEYCWGGELFDRVVGEEFLKESDVVGYVKQICEGLEYMHLNRIVHLDLKPENIICLSPNSRRVKLIDFGVARNIDEDYSRAVYGTRDYVAPEIIDYEPITTACDMWSLGVVTYTLLSGLMPFSGDTWVQRSINITRASYDYDDYAFEEVSDLAKNFVDSLLMRDPALRMSAKLALKHHWIRDGPPQGRKAKHMNKMRQNLKSYLADYRARWQRAGNVMIAAHRLRMKCRGDSSGSATPESLSRGDTPETPSVSEVPETREPLFGEGSLEPLTERSLEPLTERSPEPLMENSLQPTGSPNPSEGSDPEPLLGGPDMPFLTDPLNSCTTPFVYNLGTPEEPADWIQPNCCRGYRIASAKGYFK